MTVQMLPLWGFLLDGVQILLCILIFLFVLHNRLKYKRWILNAASQEKAEGFGDEINKQLLKQLAEKSFKNVIDAINQERLALQNQLDAGPINSKPHESVLQTPGEFNNVIQDDENGPGDSDLGNFNEIIALADKGLSIREISQRLNMPGGEVELVLRLNKDENSGSFSISTGPVASKQYSDNCLLNGI